MASLNGGCSNSREIPEIPPPRPQSTWGRWPLAQGHRGHQGTSVTRTHTQGHPRGSAVPRQQPHTRDSPRSRHKHGSYGRSRRQGGRKHRQKPTATLEPGLGLPEGVGLCRRNGIEHSPGWLWLWLWLWGQPGFPGEHLLLSAFPPSTRAGVMLSAVAGGCASTKGAVQRSCLPPAAPGEQHRGSTTASAPRPST